MGHKARQQELPITTVMHRAVHDVIKSYEQVDYCCLTLTRPETCAEAPFANLTLACVFLQACPTPPKGQRCGLGDHWPAFLTTAFLCSLLLICLSLTQQYVAQVRGVG